MADLNHLIISYVSYAYLIFLIWAISLHIDGVNVYSNIYKIWNMSTSTTGLCVLIIFYLFILVRKETPFFFFGWPHPESYLTPRIKQWTYPLVLHTSLTAMSQVPDFPIVIFSESRNWYIRWPTTESLNIWRELP